MSDGDVLIIKALHHRCPVLRDSLRVDLHEVVECNEAEVLEVLVGILNEALELLKCELGHRCMSRHADRHSVDALIQERLGGRGVEQVGDGRDHLLSQPRLERRQRSQQLPARQ